ncbi:MAG: hypothetical protein [Microviridae sp.]|nr:MAG: hypothetical protein [Microviridae sp.]
MSKLETQVDNVEELVQYEQIEGTPFTMVRHEDQYFLAMGKYRLTPLLDKQSCLSRANELPDWQMITQVIHIMVRHAIEEGLQNHPTEEDNLKND